MLSLSQVNVRSVPPIHALLLRHLPRFTVSMYSAE